MESMVKLKPHTRQQKNEEDQDEEEESGIDIAIESRNHNGVPSNEGSSSDSDFHKFRITRSKSPHKRKIRNKMKKILYWWTWVYW